MSPAAQRQDDFLHLEAVTKVVGGQGKAVKGQGKAVKRRVEG